jgi:hypothetical protein
LSAVNPYDAEHGIPASSEEWKEKGAAVAVKNETDANGNVVTRIVKKGVKDFNFGRTLGEGSYSTVSDSRASSGPFSAAVVSDSDGFRS